MNNQMTKTQILNSMAGEHAFYDDDLDVEICFYFTPAHSDTKDCPGNYQTIEVESFNNDAHTFETIIEACENFISYNVERTQELSVGI